MAAIIAIILFVLYSVGMDALGPFKTLGLGLIFLAIALIWNWVPTFRRQ